MSNVSQLTQIKKCSGEFVLAINDTMNVLNGKWKLPIIGSLLYGKKRFKELEREIPKITPRMLSKELKDLEINSIITRTVQSTIPVMVEYELSASGRSLNAVLDAMITWGKQHRERVIGKNQKISEDVED
ncbi:MAG: helix-turn-helix domain-containing protein [Lutibacter sp.]